MSAIIDSFNRRLDSNKSFQELSKKYKELVIQNPYPESSEELFTVKIKFEDDYILKMKDYYKSEAYQAAHKAIYESETWKQLNSMWFEEFYLFAKEIKEQGLVNSFSLLRTFYSHSRHSTSDKNWIDFAKYDEFFEYEIKNKKKRVSHV